MRVNQGELRAETEAGDAASLSLGDRWSPAPTLAGARGLTLQLANTPHDLVDLLEVHVGIIGGDRILI